MEEGNMKTQDNLATIVEYPDKTCKMFYLKKGRLTEFPQRFSKKEKATEMVGLMQIKHIRDPKFFRRELHLLDRMYFDDVIAERNKMLKC